MKPRYPHVLSTLALFVAIGGTTAWAIDGPNPGQNTVGSEDIIGNEIKSDDLGNGRIFNLDIADEVITGQKVKNNSLTADDINEATLPNPSGVFAIGGAGSTDACLAGDPPVGQFCKGTSHGGALTGSWSNYGNGFAPAGVWEDENGFVHLQGSVKNSVPSAGFDQTTPIFILPPGYRPSAHRAFSIVKETTPGNYTEGWLLVQDNGWVFPAVFPRSPVVFMSLDGVYFRP